MGLNPYIQPLTSTATKSAHTGDLVAPVVSGIPSLTAFLPVDRCFRYSGKNRCGLPPPHPIPFLFIYIYPSHSPIGFLGFGKNRDWRIWWVELGALRNQKHIFWSNKDA